jgi:hypothetical protein
MQKKTHETSRFDLLPDTEDSRRLQRKVQRLTSACGCDEGALAGLSYLLIFFLAVLTGYAAPRSVLGWVGGVGGFVAALFAGKIFGLALARVRLVRALRQLNRLARCSDQVR